MGQLWGKWEQNDNVMQSDSSIEQRNACGMGAKRVYSNNSYYTRKMAANQPYDMNASLL